MSIQLNFINNSNDANNSEIVIFQSSSTGAAETQMVAKKVMHCAPGSNHAFELQAEPAMGSSPVSSMQNAGLGFKPTIWVGVVPDVQEGDIADSAILSNVHTELSLTGISSADIIMTGGGPGSSPLSFHLENVQMGEEAAKSEAFAGNMAFSAMGDVHLNFINRSKDVNNSEIVVFQKNSGPGSQMAVSWTVIRNCGPGGKHPFVYTAASYVSASDSYGNYTAQLQAENGQLFHMVLTPSGDELQLAETPGSPNEIQIRNDLQKGAINAQVYKDGRLLALKTGIVPQQKAVFRFGPTLWIGVVSQMEEGAVMNSAIVSQIDTELSLMGIKSADIVMTGGGAGPNARPFEFTMDHIVYW